MSQELENIRTVNHMKGFNAYEIWSKDAFFPQSLEMLATFGSCLPYKKNPETVRGLSCSYHDELLCSILGNINPDMVNQK